jgi:PAS domain S-box-containing protein
MAHLPSQSLQDALQAALRKTSLSPDEQAPVLKSLRPYAHAYEELVKLVDLSRDLMCIASLEGHFLWVNDAFERVLGHSKADLVSRPFFDYIHPDDVEITRAKLEKLGMGLDVIRFENRYRTKDGSWRRLSWVCPAPPREATELHAITRDVTDEHP